MNSATCRSEAVHSILLDSVPRALAYRDQVLKQSADMDHLLSRMSLQDQQTYLVSILNRQDKMSMGASVEARVPFLDYRIAEFANSLPAATRIRGFDSKMLVKQVAGEHLPKEVIYRRKSGFGVPLAQWLRQPDGLGGLAAEMIHAGGYDEYLDAPALRQVYQQHISGAADHGELLWTTLNFLLWKQRFAA